MAGQVGILKRVTRPLVVRTTVVVFVVFVFTVLLVARLTAPAVELGDRRFSVEVADAEAEHERGLSGRRSLSNSHGMLFVFPQPAKTCFWMKDMHINIDILWFDAERRLIHQERNLAPATYPAKYCPKPMAKYVLEVTAGTAESLGLQSGAQLILKNL